MYGVIVPPSSIDIVSQLPLDRIDRYVLRQSELLLQAQYFEYLDIGEEII